MHHNINNKNGQKKVKTLLYAEFNAHIRIRFGHQKCLGYPSLMDFFRKAQITFFLYS